MNETLQAVIVGGIVTAGFTCLLDFLKDKRERKNALLEERKKAYQALIYDTLLTRMDAPQSKQKFYNLMVLLTIYGSKKIVKAFYAFNRESTDSNKHMKKIIELVRAEIGINEKLYDEPNSVEKRV